LPGVWKSLEKRLGLRERRLCQLLELVSVEEVEDDRDA
jgi:hypothetical protein